jgi:hypothetical protein
MPELWQLAHHRAPWYLFFTEQLLQRRVASTLIWLMRGPGIYLLNQKKTPPGAWFLILHDEHLHLRKLLFQNWE